MHGTIRLYTTLTYPIMHVRGTLPSNVCDRICHTDKGETKWVRGVYYFVLAMSFQIEDKQTEEVSLELERVK